MQHDVRGRAKFLSLTEKFSVGLVTMLDEPLGAHGCHAGGGSCDARWSRWDGEERSSLVMGLGEVSRVGCRDI